MDWTEVSIEIAAEDVETAAGIAQMVVPYGIYIEDYSDMLEVAPTIAHVDFIDDELLQKDVTKAIIHVYISPEESPAEAIIFLTEHLEAVKINSDISQKTVKQSDWANSWKTYYHATKLGERLVVCPSWEEYQPQNDEVIITIDPGMAFGTGTHDTTRLCLQLLENYSGSGKKVLDVGSGSGILSISSVLLGCDSALGVEIDPMAVKVAEENNAINKTTDRVQFICGDLVEKVTGKFEIICANIVADVIIGLLPSIDMFLQDDGVFIASGIIDVRENDVLAAIDSVGLQVVDNRKAGGWVALACKRR